MKSTTNNLLIILGGVLVSAMLVSAALDVSRAVPGIMAGSRELASGNSAGLTASGGAAVVQELNLLRSVIQKERPILPVEPPGAVQPLLPPVVPNTGAGLPAETDGNEDAVQTTAAVEETAAPAATPQPDIPDRIVIPSIQLDAPIVPAETVFVKVSGKEYQQWKSPNKYAVGWHESSALLGAPGNTVLNGHHNISGKVFEHLVDLNPGELIIVLGRQRAYVYMITNKMIFPEKYQELDVRMDNSRWILPSEDERLTLVTCWPETSNTHRLVIVAKPLRYFEQQAEGVDNLK